MRLNLKEMKFIKDKYKISNSNQKIEFNNNKAINMDKINNNPINTKDLISNK